MITCLILWIPSGTTYRPFGPPMTSLTDVIRSFLPWPGWDAWPDDAHAASRAAMSRAATTAYHDLTRTRLFPIPSLS